MASEPLKILVTGASGQLGRAVYQTVKNRNWNVIGLAFSRCKEEYIKCDLTNESEIEKVLMETKPDFIVHTAVERYPNRFENHLEKTEMINVTATETIARLAKKINCKLVFISTDYVFDGKNPPYYPDSQTNPLNVYAETKLKGEEVVLKAYKEGTIILRIPVLYGPVEYIKESAVTSLALFLLDPKPAEMSHCERRYPCYTYDLANIICDLMKLVSKDSSLIGLYQWSGLEMLTNYSIIKTIAEEFSLDHSHITPGMTPFAGATRPFDPHMDNSKLNKLFISHHTPFKSVIKDILQKYMTNGQ